MAGNEVTYTRPEDAASSRVVFGQVMWLVAATVACAALGAYLGKNMSGGGSLLLFLPALGCIIGLNFAARKNQMLAVGLLFGAGLFLGLAVAPVLSYYASAHPAVLWQSAAATALTVGAMGAYGYATRKDLSSWSRGLFFALLGLIVVGIVMMFVNIPGGNTIYALAGIGIFSAYTIFDFNRLRRADGAMAVPIAASIFLDVFNIFLLFLTLFGGGRR